jgi:hypothetical protein
MRWRLYLDTSSLLSFIFTPEFKKHLPAAFSMKADQGFARWYGCLHAASLKSDFQAFNIFY